MRPGGGTSVTAVLRELIASPAQLSSLLRIAADAYTARGALLRARRMLGPAFGLVDLGYSDLPAAIARIGEMQNEAPAAEVTSSNLVGRAGWHVPNVCREGRRLARRAASP